MKTLTLFLISGFMFRPNAPEVADIAFVADILTIIVGVLAIASITIVGVQYLTAPSGSPKIRQSKRHLIEIISCVVLYAIIYALLHYVWLIFVN